MHEVGLIQSVMDAVVMEAYGHGMKKVTLITLSVGKLSGASPQALEFGFYALRIGTELEETELQVVEVSPVFSCTSCHKTFAADDRLFICPHCGAYSLEVVHGEELVIASFEGT